MNRRDLFPLPSYLKVQSQSVKGSRSRKRRRTRILSLNIQHKMTIALNGLAQGKVGVEKYVDPLKASGDEKRRNSAQIVAKKFLEEIAESAVRRRYFALDAASEGLYDYTDDVKNHRVWLDPGMVSLPTSGAAGIADFLSLLPPKLRPIYEEENSRLVLNQPSPCPRFFLGVSANKYHHLISKLVNVGVVLLQEKRPKVINGVFAVPKDENKQRLIIDARPANAHLVEPEKAKLPNPGDLGLLYVERNMDIFFCKSDMDNFTIDWQCQLDFTSSLVYHQLCLKENRCGQ